MPSILIRMFWMPQTDRILIFPVLPGRLYYAGQYQMEIRVNGQDISPSAFQIAFLEPPFSDSDNEKPLPEPCLTPEIVSRMGLTEASQEKVTYWNNGQCADFRQLSGVEIRPNPAEGMLYINMPQAGWNIPMPWLPPSRWDNGIPGLLFDYNINGTVNKPHQGKQSQSLNYNGTAGLTSVPGVCVRTIRAT